jgi:mRNA interferase MazF
MKRGTIVLTKFPFTDLQSFKRRPAVIVSSENRLGDDFIVAFITSVISESLSETDLLFDSHHKDFKKSGLIKPSVIKSDKLATLNKSVFTGELGTISSETLREIDKRLKIALALS